VSRKTLLQEAIDRLDFLKPEDIYISTNEDYIDLVLEQATDVPSDNIILEPALRSTAPCIGLAARVVAQKAEKDEVMCIIYADQFIKNKDKFQEVLQATAKHAQETKTLNIIEVSIESPNTNFGYVEMGKQIGNTIIDEVDIFELVSFKEKPDKKTALEYMEKGSYLWNTGIYVWRVDTINEQFEKYSPDLDDKLNKIVSEYGSTRYTRTLKKIYPTCKKNSIDYEIMENVDPKMVHIVKTEEMGWSDIGTWETIYEKGAKDENSNVIRGDVNTENVTNSLIYNLTTSPINLVGLNHHILVCTKNGTLSCEMGKSHLIKELL